MVELGWDTTQVLDGRDSAVCSTIPIAGHPPFRRTIRTAGMWKPELLKGAPLVLLASTALLFAGLIGGKAITDKLQNDGLQSEINLRLLEVTR
ncbi:MAG: hypothetical protein AMJ88_11220 [Anaerolineae bacterium SM23_ 63]|nr:MAG: hypothetical protein AMJ88_11220 [Anaerolineae bacterium SM23_ 63]HEY47139.1 hypothetical protein [Anaerolineae bacterium]